MAASSTVGADSCVGAGGCEGADVAERPGCSLFCVDIAPMHTCIVSFEALHGCADPVCGLGACEPRSHLRCLSSVDATARQKRQGHHQHPEQLIEQRCRVGDAVVAEECMTYRWSAQCRCGCRDLSVMCSSSPGDARSWCAQAVRPINSCPMLRLRVLGCVCEARDAGRLLWAVEKRGRGQRSKRLLPLGRAWAPRAGATARAAYGRRQQL
jgi:hypothetical protein